jgi:hypothetical protein
LNDSVPSRLILKRARILALPEIANRAAVFVLLRALDGDAPNNAIRIFAFQLLIGPGASASMVTRRVTPA